MNLQDLHRPSWGMARRPGPDPGQRRRRLPSLLAGLTAIVALLPACTPDEPRPDGPTTAPLRVTTQRGSGLSEDARARAESQVGDVLARYVQAGFLGDFPRSDFVPAFADFTSGAAEQAVSDIDVLTATRYSEARGVRATRLEADLSFYVVDGEAVGATAWIRFDFEIDRGSPREASLQGRLVLVRRHQRWSVFVYDVQRDDAGALRTGASS